MSFWGQDHEVMEQNKKLKCFYTSTVSSEALEYGMSHAVAKYVTRPRFLVANK